MSYVFAVFLLVHGLIHLSWLVPRPLGAGADWPFDVDRSSLLSVLRIPDATVHRLGSLFAASAVGIFAASALGAAGLPWLDLVWATVTLAGGIISGFLILAYWRRWFFFGLAVDVALVVIALTGAWPATLIR